MARPGEGSRGWPDRDAPPIELSEAVAGEWSMGSSVLGEANVITSATGGTRVGLGLGLAALEAVVGLGDLLLAPTP